MSKIASFKKKITVLFKVKNEICRKHAQILSTPTPTLILWYMVEISNMRLLVETPQKKIIIKCKGLKMSPSGYRPHHAYSKCFDFILVIYDGVKRGRIFNNINRSPPMLVLNFIL